ncbi:FAD binding domain-containing protein [Plectosphaerella plurivora]|uniref:FAD binding domain-containing protein n=1 Tax=Plectosphaerella plurivora TaxID=936078 RepID=A0A9P9AAT2_9PEZI|nr:FAD binding domain-containing protein [Plectosphaerella plurivora]
MAFDPAISYAMAPSNSLSSQLVLALSCLSPWTSASCTPACKAYPGTADWPAPDVWDKFNCPAVAAGWSTYGFHLENPLSVMWNNWSNDTCLPNPDYPCSPAGYPAYAIDASTSEHVKLGVDFARKHHVRLNIKNTGHDFHGRSNAPGSLSIWVHHLNKTDYHNGSFKPEGCRHNINGNALTVGGGATGGIAVQAAGQRGQAIVGGMAASVGLAGYTSGGGHSVLSSTYGLGVDQILQLEVVTPAGHILTVNECQNQDLFWALRGGGGTTFGVVTALTIKTYPSPKMTQWGIQFVVPPSAPFFWDVVAYVFSQLPTLGDAGLTGYFISSAEDNSMFGFKAGVGGSTTILDHDTTKVAQLLQKMNETMQHRWSGTGVYTAPPAYYDNYVDWFEVYQDRLSAGGSVLMNSRLLGKDVLEGDVAALTHALKTAGSTHAWEGIPAYLIAGKGTAEAKPRGGSNAVHPAWREAYLHTLAINGFGPFDEAGKKSLIERFTTGWQPMRDLTPGGGSYLNEAFTYEPDYERTFWGENYERLLRIKRKTDPTDVFWCRLCVGRDRWAEQHDGRLCRV